MYKKIVELENLEFFVDEFIKNVKAPFFIGLKGEMGAGKTTFTRVLINKITNKKNIVNSPTFSLMNIYETEKNTIVHADLFRLNNYEDLIFSGIEEYLFDEESIIIIEWYDKIDFPIPKNSIEIEIKIISENERLFIIN